MDPQLKKKKILICSVPADGHFNPLTGVAKFLQQKGFDVRWFTSIHYQKKLNELGIPHYPFKKTLEVTAENIGELFPEIRTNDPVKRITVYRIQYAKRSTELFDDIQEILKTFPADLIITDSLFPAIPFIKQLNIPLIAVGIVPLAQDSVDTAPYGLALHPPETDDQRDLYARLYQENPDRYKEATDIFESLIKGFGIPYQRAIMEDTLTRYPDLYLQIGSPSFEYQRSDLSSNIRFIGGLLPYKKDYGDNTWYDPKLNNFNKVVLVTQGTVEKDVTKLLEPTLAAFQGKDVLVIATTSGNDTARLREKYLSENTIIEDFIPFDALWPYVDVFVTNGGYGGTIQSILHQVPIVSAGLHEGKNEVCARISYFKVGIDLKTETPAVPDIQQAVYQILNDVTFKQNLTRLSGDLSAYKPLDLIGAYVEQLIN